MSKVLSFNQFRSEVSEIWKSEAEGNKKVKLALSCISHLMPTNASKAEIISAAWIEYKAMYTTEVKRFCVHTKGGQAWVVEKSPVAAWNEAERLGWNPLHGKLPFAV